MGAFLQVSDFVANSSCSLNLLHGRRSNLQIHKNTYTMNVSKIILTGTATAALALFINITTSIAQVKQRVVRDRAENVLDKREDRRDKSEGVRDRKENRRDRREDVRDAKHEGGRRDKLEDRFDKREDKRDRKENRRDRKENVRDRKEDLRDRKN